MELKENTFKELLQNHSFKIPEYQKEYYWGEKQINVFIDDLLEFSQINTSEENEQFKKYYLGHFILEKADNEEISYIMDGQQRITTVYLFLLVCAYFEENKNIYDFIRFSPASDDIAGLETIKRTLNYKKKGISILENLSSQAKTLSFKRMFKAIEILIKSFNEIENKKGTLEISKIKEYLKIIYTAYCTVAIFNDKAVASQIFELHNKHGFHLVETEM